MDERADTGAESPDEGNEGTGGISRRRALQGAALAGAVWVTPSVTSLGSAWAADSPGSPPPDPTDPPTDPTDPPTDPTDPPGDAVLRVVKTGPIGVFTGQQFDFTVTVFNDGSATATNVVVIDTLPTEGSFVSSTPAGTLAGGLTVNLGDIPAGGSATVVVTWLAPDVETELVNLAVASADNATGSSDVAVVPVGAQTTVTGAGATAAGVSLRNRLEGDITISDLPADAVVTRAVLVWAYLKQGDPPGNGISVNGSPVTANLEANLSQRLCWGDDGTIGYAADVTGLVTGNGSYTIADYESGGADPNTANPSPLGFPQIEGATLVVVYEAPGIDNQVLTDFSYDAVAGGPAIVRTFSGVVSTGGAATLIATGPDGQTNAGELLVASSSSGSVSFPNVWDGSDPNPGPDFSIGNLWDTDKFDISAVVPAGTTEVTATLDPNGDCIGVSAMVLIVEQ